jgi:hypothetical protein
MKEYAFFFIALAFIGLGGLLGWLDAPNPEPELPPAAEESENSAAMQPTPPTQRQTASPELRTAGVLPEKPDDQTRPLSETDKALIRDALARTEAPAALLRENEPLWEIMVVELRRNKALGDALQTRSLGQEIAQMLTKVEIENTANGKKPNIAARQYVSILNATNRIAQTEAARALLRLTDEAKNQGKSLYELPLEYRTEVLLDHYLRLLLPIVRAEGLDSLRKLKPSTP